MRRLGWLLLVLGCALTARTARAQGSPTREATPAASWPAGGGDTNAVRAAMQNACDTTGHADPIIGCPLSPPPSVSPIPEPVHALRQFFDLGLNAGVTGLFPAWGEGVNIAGAGGVSLLFGTWFYEGTHRVTAIQADADVAYSVLGSRGAAWMLAVGTVYQGWDDIFPAVKAQVFASRLIKDSPTRLQAIGIALSISADFVFWRPAQSPQPPLNPAKPVFLFDDGSRGEPTR